MPSPGYRLIPAAIEDIVGDDQNKQSCSQQLMGKIIQPPVGKAGDNQADREEVEQQTNTECHRSYRPNRLRPAKAERSVCKFTGII